jgi:hypothetical protein
MKYRYKKYNTADAVSNGISQRAARKKEFEKIKKNIERVRNSPSSIKILYPKYKEAFEYVDNLFPYCNVKDVTVYKVRASLLEKLGFGGAGGFYDRLYKTVVFASGKSSKSTKYSTCAKIDNDDVIVHELLHYCYFDEGKSCSSVALQEEFAYGNSIGYLRKKGYSDEEIVENNFLPFLVGNVRNKVAKSVLSENGVNVSEYNSYSISKKQKIMKRLGKKIHERSVEIAKENGLALIAIYSKDKKKDKKIRGEDSRFTFIDLD